MRTLLLNPLLAFLATACAATSSNKEHQHSWVWILTGQRDATVQGNERNAAFAGHFANMDRMAKAGELLVAGPFGEPRAQADHRGIFVLTTSDSKTAQAVAASDPTTQAGVFHLVVEPFRTSDELERLNAMHNAAVRASGLVDPPPGYHCRSYVLVAGEPAEAAELAIREAPVLFRGRLGTGAAERTLACLDATTVDEARAMLPGDGGVHWTLMPWFSTEEIARLNR